MLAHIAEIPLIFLAMYADISFANLPSCRTIDIGAKYVVGVHGLLSWFQHHEFAFEPLFL